MLHVRGCCDDWIPSLWIWFRLLIFESRMDRWTGNAKCSERMNSDGFNLDTFPAGGYVYPLTPPSKIRISDTNFDVDSCIFRTPLNVKLWYRSRRGVMEETESDVHVRIPSVAQHSRCGTIMMTAFLCWAMWYRWCFCVQRHGVTEASSVQARHIVRSLMVEAEKGFHDVKSSRWS